MFKNLLASIVLLFLLLFSSPLHAVDLDWNHDYEKALAQAKKEHKLVYLFIGADNCRYCDRFYKWTLSDGKVIKDMEEKYVLIYMSRDKHNVPDKFEKHGVPYHYFLTSDGEIIHKDQGSREIEGWYDVLDEVDLKKDDFLKK